MTLAIDRARIAELVLGIGSTDEAKKDLDKALCRAFKVKRVDDLKAQIRQYLELEGEDSLAHEGYAATLSPPPADLWLDVSNQALTDAVILTAFKAGLLTLDKAQYRSEKRSTAELDAFRSAVVKGEGTRRLSIGREDA